MADRGIQRLRPAAPSRISSRRARPDVPEALEQLASAVGIQTSYRDNSGQVQRASLRALRSLLGLWGLPSGGEVELREALQEIKLRGLRQPLREVSVVWDGRPTTVTLQFPCGADLSAARLALELEDGTRIDVSRKLTRAKQSTISERGEKFSRAQVALPRLPLGYHMLVLEWRARRDTSMIISAPTKTYSDDSLSGGWGFFVPMYALRSNRSWGAGDLTQWAQLSDWAETVGANVMASLPLLAAFLDKPICEASPYSPASRLFWNEFYVDVERVPEFNVCRQAQRLVNSNALRNAIQGFRDQRYINYREQYAAKRRVLELLASHFFSNVSSRHRTFQGFLKQNPRVSDYAQFRAAGDQAGVSWHNWEPRLRYGKLQPEDYSEADRRFHIYSQWVAHEQFSGVVQRARKRRSLFYLDLPLGVNPDGYDLWREGPSFAQGASVGAPPDMFFTKGQNWGFSPLHPRAIRERRYDYVIEYLRFQMRNASLLRMDHVMGLHRLWWIPQGASSAVDGAYVSYPAEELYAILSLESHRHKTMLVGENLGTVPPEVNTSMDRHAVRKMYVLQYEQRPDPKKPVRPPERSSVASLNTHDMPAFAAHWEGRDIQLREELGLLRGKAIVNERERRAELLKALASFLRKQGLLSQTGTDARGSARACLRWLAKSDAEFMLVSLEDLWAEAEPQNVPGTSVERPNWARKLSRSLEDVTGDQELREFCFELSRLRRRE